MPNTGSPFISVKWVNTSLAAFTNISLLIFRPCLPGPSILSSAGNLKVCDRFDTGSRPSYMAIQSELPTAKDRCNVLDAKFLLLWSWGWFISVFYATDPSDHGMVITAEPLQLRFLSSPRFATMEHSQAYTGLLHLATYPGWEVSGG